MEEKAIETNSSKKDEAHFGGEHCHRKHDDDNYYSRSRGHPDRLDRFNIWALPGGAQIFYQQRGQAMQERFVVENVFIQNAMTDHSDCPNNLCLLVFVRNTGVEQINVVAIYVNGTSVATTGTYVVNPYPDPPNQISDSIPAAPGQNLHEYLLNIVISPTSPFTQSFMKKLTTGSTLYIVVASARGNRATYTVRVYVPGT